jgi:transglutaminase/protease-like cytokinesis protein 3
VPAVEHEILIALPCAGPAYFKHGVELAEFSTSAQHLENLEMAHFHCNVPEDVEVIAETETRALACDADGDYFESGDTVSNPALAQAEWHNGRKRFTIKSLLPPASSSDGTAVVKVYAGKRGLMHSIKDNPHALAFALPLTHTGQNPAYDFLVRHPTPHAQRHDLYVVQPQCKRLVVNNTFVFHMRQHPSSLSRFSPDTWGTNASSNRSASPNPGMARPSSAMSMISTTQSVSQSGSATSNGDMTAAQSKPAKLAIQSPSQKIIRLTRKVEHTSRADGRDALDEGLVTSWETVVKMSERGTWRGLVLADRSARWCVFAEWECV